MKFKAEISEKEIPFLDTTVFKGQRFYEDAILDIRTLFLTDIRGTQREFSSKPLKHSIVKRILVFKR